MQHYCLYVDMDDLSSTSITKADLHDNDDKMERHPDVIKFHQTLDSVQNNLVLPGIKQLDRIALDYGQKSNNVKFDSEDGDNKNTDLEPDDSII